MPVFTPGGDEEPVRIPTLSEDNATLSQQIQMQEATRVETGGNVVGRVYVQSDIADPSANYNEVITTSTNKRIVLTDAGLNPEERFVLSRLTVKFGDTYEFEGVARSQSGRTSDFVAINSETGQIVNIDTTKVGVFTAPGTTAGRVDEKGGYDRRTGTSTRTRYRRTSLCLIQETPSSLMPRVWEL